ncbi:MAG: PEP-CTERM sorting domain-containing protein [Paludisphaera borealis]|uniref:PEP-CTERM sorting domain-containing protein n=1 Tax=Paludisphaera borealis TaxID=1387353 RepID=UPI00284F85B0|nr:PEP-CTERM sorting domain-containing protein [Paludisphaera borealis]MDR3623185.1 PEP-CTERM sorting domain-containing protein [Paludisphaera borealis]
MFMTSLQETRGHHLGRCGSLAARLVLVGAIGLFAAVRAEASPYIATDLGRVSDMQQKGQSFDNTKTGVSYAFPVTVRQLAGAEWNNLPSYTADVSQPPRPIWDHSELTKTVTMHPQLINDSGTVIGTLDTIVDRFGNSVSTNIGYAVRSPDGTYSPFVTMATAPNGAYVHLFLSQANQILALGQSSTWLVDLNKGTSTTIDQLVPQQILQNYPGIPFVQGIDDRGDIVIYADNQFTGSEAFMLTPPGLDPPAVPEPSTLLIFAAAGALAVRTVGRRKKG